MMRIRLSVKLFLAFFLILAMSVGTLLLARYLSARNVAHFMHQLDLQRLDPLVSLLQEEYRSLGNWDGFREDPRRLDHLSHLSSDMERSYRPPPPPNDAPPGPGGPGNPGPFGGPSRIFLLDANHLPINGKPEPGDEDQMISIAVDGQTVGYLGLNHYEPFRSGPPAALLQRQTMQFYLLGAGLIALTALIAFLFSRHLLVPIRRLTRGTRALADRNFTIRIRATTGDELGQLAENFNAMARTLENYERMRRQWLTDISHELRTPLAVLRGEIEAILDGIREPTPDNLSSLHGEILRIGKIVEDLHFLSMADADRLQLNRQRVSPATILDPIVVAFRPRFERGGLQLELKLDETETAWIDGDADRLTQAFNNILDNALKYVAPPGALAIIGRTEKNQVRLSFRDTGPGVPEEALGLVFDRLFRVDASRSRNTGGSGLGLSICRDIIENHGGRIWAENNAGGGLIIEIALPRHNETNQ